MAKGKEKIKAQDRPARDEMPLAKTTQGACPLNYGRRCTGKKCELFSTEAPEDDTRTELKHAGYEYTGMCSLRMMAEALASMSRKHSNLADF